MKKSRWKFWSFIALALVTTIILLIGSFVYVPLAIDGMEDVSNPIEWKKMFTDRAPYIFQSIINLLLFIIICICGAALYSDRMRNAKNGFLIIAAVSCVSTFFLHSMVYGVDIFVPSAYSLFSPYHRPLMVVGLVQTTVLVGNSLLNTIFSIVIHTLAPQVLLGIFVSVLADRKYKAVMGRKKVAFICVHNSCRSQIAEALCQHFAGGVFDCYSAGTETKPQINQDAVRLVKEIYGINMEKTQYSKLLSDIPPVDIVVTMGCNVECPFLLCRRREDWGLDDPTGKKRRGIY
jgi:arsenate reductase